MSEGAKAHPAVFDGVSRFAGRGSKGSGGSQDSYLLAYHNNIAPVVGCQSTTENHQYLFVYAAYTNLYLDKE